MEPRTFELEFAKFIQKFHEPIKEAFVEDTFHKRKIFSGCAASRAMLEELADDILKEFMSNVDKRTAKEIIAERYTKLGVRSCRDNVPCSDLVRCFTLLKRHVWLFFQENNFAGQPFDVRSIVALNNRTALFFDRAVYYFLKGYEQAADEAKNELESLYSVFLTKVSRDLNARCIPVKNETEPLDL